MAATWGRLIPRALVLASILLGPGEGALAQPCEPSFRSGTPLDFIQPNYSVIGAFDFNGDGRKELLYTTPSAARIALNAGNGTFKEPNEVLYFGAAVAVGDMDGDGILDLVAVGQGIKPGTSFIGVYKGFLSYQGYSVYFQNVTSLAGPLGASSPVLGDFDGNGTLDLAVLVNGLYVWIYPGDGHGGFGEPRSFTVNNVFSAGQLWSADLNGDGRTDLLIRAYGFKSSFLKTWISNANGSFTEISDGPRGGGYESGFSLALGDVDGDGRTDVVVTNILGLNGARGSIETWLSRPNGFVHVSQPSSPFGLSVLADFDGDGRIDLAAVETSGRSLVVQLGDGTGKFADPLQFPLPSVATTLNAADFDGDGHVDIVVGLFGWLANLYKNTCGRGIERTLVVPVVVSLPGAAGTYWESDLTITNSGAKDASVDFTYTASTGGGSGTVTAALPAGTQLSSPSAFELLSTLGLNLPAGVPRSGTLRAVFHNLASPHAAGISVRTSSGGAGVAYPGIEPPASTTQIVTDLRQNARDRTNLGVMHAGTASDGPIQLHIALTTTDGGPVQNYPLGIFTLQPGEFRQFDRVLATSDRGASSAVAKITSLTGPPIPFVSWGVVNDDTGTSDGSFQLGQAWGYGSWALPSVVESLAYETELTLVNSSDGPCNVTLVYHSSNLASPSGATVLTIPLPGLRTYRFDDIVDELRRADPAGVGPRGPTYVGTLEVGAACTRVFASSRVLGTAQRYGVAPNGIVRPSPNPGYVPSLHSAWIPDLRQDGRTRSNLAIANLSWSAASYLVELFDASGRPVASRRVATSDRGWLQINSILADWAPGTARGWARVSEVEPQYALSFAAYSILNDGASPGLGTGDGSIVWMEPEP
ncbi:MAG TPA: VCBS repeat-containing protein [Thermoanaerobaculia bacterium]|jgi:hypothetical protein